MCTFKRRCYFPRLSPERGAAREAQAVRRGSAPWASARRTGSVTERSRDVDHRIGLGNFKSIRKGKAIGYNLDKTINGMVMKFMK